MTQARIVLVAVAVLTLAGSGALPAGARPAAREAPSTAPLEWSRVDDPVVLRPSTVVRDVACTRTGPTCVAVGERSDQEGRRLASIQRWDGSAWRADAPGTGSTGLVRVSCGTADDCVALEPPRWEGGLSRRIAARSAAGWRWVTFEVAQESTEYTAVSCVSPDWCLLTGAGREAAVFDGSTVRPLPRTIATVFAVSCTSPQFCAAIGDTAFMEWDGTRWDATPLETSGYLRDVDCWAVEQCLATVQADDGATSVLVRAPGAGWVPGAAPGGRDLSDAGGVVGLPGLACVADGRCHLLRLEGPRRAPRPQVATWQAGSWTTSSLPRPDGVLTSLACHPGECVAVSVEVNSFAEATSSSALHGGGATWTAHDMVNPSGLLAYTGAHELSCAGPGWCLALGSSAGAEPYVVRGGANGWTEIPAALADQRDLDCWRPGACVVVGSDGTRPRAAVLRQGRWQALPPISPDWLATGVVTGVGCRAGRCSYSGYYRSRRKGPVGIFVAERSGGTWRAERIGPTIDDEFDFTGRPSMDCPSATRCVAVVSMMVPGQVQPTTYAATRDAGGWRWATLGRDFSLFEIDCADAAHCLAGGEDGRPGLVMSWTAGSGWRRVAVRTRNAAFFSLACPTSRTCYAAGQGTRVQVLTRAGNGWRSRPAGPENLLDIACAGPRSCVAFNGERTWAGS